jgi:VIT1/CCC1 family predicted Fe2+/Mn2+ transporter
MFFFEKRSPCLPLPARHRSSTSLWLRAAALGANDGILSTSRLVLGVAARGSHGSILVAGASGLVAGGMSMAAGEYVSGHSLADMEGADLVQVRDELRTNVTGERAELAAFYVSRGLDRGLAGQSRAAADSA